MVLMIINLDFLVNLTPVRTSVNHTTLISTLNELGIRCQALLLLVQQKSKREKSRNGQFLSDELLMRSGSVLGPTLYLLFINNIKMIQFKIYYTIYADDTCVLTKI